MQAKKKRMYSISNMRSISGGDDCQIHHNKTIWVMHLFKKCEVLQVYYREPSCNTSLHMSGCVDLLKIKDLSMDFLPLAA